MYHYSQCLRGGSIEMVLEHEQDKGGWYDSTTSGDDEAPVKSAGGSTVSGGSGGACWVDYKPSMTQL